MSKKKVTRRELIQKATYVTPFILTLAVNPSYAAGGSTKEKKEKKEKREKVE